MMWSENKVLKKIAAGQVPYGFEIMLGSPRIVEMVGWAGFDYIQLDQEHTPFGLETIEDMVRAADATGLTSLVRVAQNNPKDISRALETGAHGVIVPQVTDAADVQKALDSVYYAPRGQRGMCPVTRGARYDDAVWEEYLAWVQKEVMFIPLIENASALESIDEICALPGVSVIGFGAGDLGQSLGVGAQGLAAPIVREAFAKVRETARRHNVVLKGMPVIGDDPAKAVRNLLDMGVGMVMYDADALLFSRECRNIMNGIRSLSGG
ncbi:aldolase/citrate lyase family protein [Bosea sp. (in: a-proteobacteria)]|uniref:HpcH/HpaI aldolase family protein n=1 Tax=Bosea sp. (in: a-proteobacteria) TaxID=1871050 RepID=UPI0026178BC3|nr:aldolase/citrate lyase family protein [Bosea sp. (in: a-proteobacteria)]MCO5089849.1 aldolase/citrate lyase family protein [Bosea sp. (in: a-proteobacteria)]